MKVAIFIILLCFSSVFARDYFFRARKAAWERAGKPRTKEDWLVARSKGHYGGIKPSAPKNVPQLDGTWKGSCQIPGQWYLESNLTLTYHCGHLVSSEHVFCSSVACNDPMFLAVYEGQEVLRETSDRRLVRVARISLTPETETGVRYLDAFFAGKHMIIEPFKLGVTQVVQPQRSNGLLELLTLSLHFEDSNTIKLVEAPHLTVNEACVLKRV
jgi:hypothetical protein